MTKYVLSDYLAAFKLANVGEKFKNGGWFFLVYVMFCYPIFRVGNTEDEMGMLEWIKYFLVIIPPIYAVITSTLIPVSMTKQMFLIPLNKDKRREYINKMHSIKIAVPIVMLTISAVILLATGMMDVTVALGFFVSNALTSFFYGTNIDSQKYSRAEERGVLSASSSGTMLLCEIVMPISTFFANIVYLAIDCKQDSLMIKLIIVFTAMLFQLPTTIAYCRCWPIIREKFSEYETCLRKSDKEEV